MRREDGRMFREGLYWWDRRTGAVFPVVRVADGTFVAKTVLLSKPRAESWMT